MIFHIPHASSTIPVEIRQAILLSDEELDRELLRMTDHYTDDLFESHARKEDFTVVARVSRLVVDMERFEDDSKEEMSKIGMGCVYTHTSDLQTLRSKPSMAERSDILQKYYLPHHQALNSAVNHELNAGGYSAFILDCHSFPSAALPYELDQSTDRPDFCLGADEFHTPEVLINLVTRFLESKGYTVALNSPFSGSIVSLEHYFSDPSVESLMIEVNRSLYMDEANGEKCGEYSEIKSLIGQLTELIRCYVETDGSECHIVQQLGTLLVTKTWDSESLESGPCVVTLHELNGAYYSVREEGVEKFDSLYSALIGSDATTLTLANVAASFEDAVMNAELSEADLIAVRSNIDHRIQEWLGFHIPEVGDEDYDRWQSRVLDAEDIKTMGDVEYWAEMYTSGELIDFFD